MNHLRRALVVSDDVGQDLAQPELGGAASRCRSATSALLRIAVRGWFSPCASDAVNSAMADTRPMCASAARSTRGSRGSRASAPWTAWSKELPVLVMRDLLITAHDDLPTLERIGKSGAAGHLRKPFDPRPF
jgi:hypothetical protein